VLTEDWKIAYNAEHPHSSLGYRSPRIRGRLGPSDGGMTPLGEVARGWAEG